MQKKILKLLVGFGVVFVIVGGILIARTRLLGALRGTIAAYRVVQLEAELAQRRPEVRTTPLDTTALMLEVFMSYVSTYPVEVTALAYEANYLLTQGKSREAALLLEARGRERLTAYELEVLGISYLRIGEDENCVAEHNPDSCLFPVQEKGIHRHQAGGKAALEVFGLLATKHPERSDWRWLAVISAMISGRYPQDLPPAAVVAPEWITRTSEFPRFRDRAIERGLRDLGGSSGVIVDDFDGDGWFEIVNLNQLGSSKDIVFQIFQRDRDGRYVELSELSGLRNFERGLHFAQVDFDNDGLLDIFIARGAWQGRSGQRTAAFLRNEGELKFRDVSHEMGEVLRGPSQAFVWADFDLDGDLDLFFGCEHLVIYLDCESRYFENVRGKLVDRSRQANLLLKKFVKGAIGFDYDGDGLMDLAISDLFGRSVQVYRNHGVREGVPYFELTATLPSDPFSLLAFDYDNDGDEDLLVPGYCVDLALATAHYFVPDFQASQQRMQLFENVNGRFVDVAPEKGLAHVTMSMGLNFGDFNNDGFLDFYLGTGGPSLARLVPNRAFLNQAGKAFKEVTVDGGFGNLQKGHGVAFADLRGIGAQDVYASLGGMMSSDVFQDALFENPGPQGNWLALKLEGVTANCHAVGARVRVKTEAGEFFRVVSTGGSFGAQPLEVFVGLGPAKTILELEVSWPSLNYSQKQVFTKLAVNRRYHLKQGADLELRPRVRR